MSARVAAIAITLAALATSVDAASPVSLEEVKARTRAYLPWEVQKLEASSPHLIKGRRPAFAGSPTSGRHVAVVDLYIDRRSGRVLALEVVEAPHRNIAKLLHDEMLPWRFNPLEVNDNGPVKVTIAVYFSYLGNGTMEVSTP